MIDRIKSGLLALENEEGIRILYACESGSRAWGFPSPDSDYDVRFIYVRNLEWYLRIEEARDVVERPIESDLDLCGWDLKKALVLFKKSNPPLLEWLQSPIIYLEWGGLRGRLHQLLPEFYSPLACMHHYLHMAEGNFKDYLRGTEVKHKKYFYVLRPILACKWIELGNGVVPMEFGSLLEKVILDGQLRKAIEQLLAVKSQSGEMAVGSRIPVIQEFIETELVRLKDQIGPKPPKKPDAEKLNVLFRSVIEEAWT